MPWDRRKPLCLVGMSGAGKSYWAARLAERYGFGWWDCDAAIADRVAELAPPPPGKAPVTALGLWMDMPWSEGYEERERRYLELEEEITEAFLDRALARPGPQTLDPTGSVVYLSAELRERIAREAYVVHLRTPPSAQASMLQRYQEDPKPVIFHGRFVERPGESQTDALTRCFGELLEDRERRYGALAARSVDARQLEADGATVDDFLRSIE